MRQAISKAYFPNKTTTKAHGLSNMPLELGRHTEKYRNWAGVFVLQVTNCMSISIKLLSVSDESAGVQPQEGDTAGLTSAAAVRRAWALQYNTSRGLWEACFTDLAFHVIMHSIYCMEEHWRFLKLHVSKHANTLCRQTCIFFCRKYFWVSSR